MSAVARVLDSAADVAFIELNTARRRSSDPKGLHRYAGAVREGTWEVAEALPRIAAGPLREALTLCEAIENGRRLTARDESEAAEIEARVLQRLRDYFGANGLQRNGAEIALRRRDPSLFEHIVARVFWARYAAVWPLQDEDADAGPEARS